MSILAGRVRRLPQIRRSSLPKANSPVTDMDYAVEGSGSNPVNTPWTGICQVK